MRELVRRAGVGVPGSERCGWVRVGGNVGGSVCECVHTSCAAKERVGLPWVHVRG